MIFGFVFQRDEVSFFFLLSHLTALPCICSTTLSVDELLAMGGEDAEAVLTHRSTDSSLTVG